MLKRSGFTLAEVLITLVIIGVIAAMTIPTLMNNTNSQEYRTGLKKSISMLNQAITMQYALDGTSVSDYSSAGGASLRDNLFAKRLNVISTANSATFGGVASQSVFYTADGIKFGIATAYASGCDAAGTTPCFDMLIDVNGDRKPNVVTAASSAPKDIYYATMYSQRVVPYGAVTQGVMFDQ